MFRNLILMSFFVLGFVAHSFAQNLDNEKYVVMVAAYIEPVSITNFKGLSGVYQTKDNNDIYRYYIGGFNTEADAQATKSQAVAAGFRNAQIWNMAEIRENCRKTCGFTAPVTVPEEISSLRWIFFDFDQSNIRSDARLELEKLISVMSKYPTYTVELAGHTDAKGSDAYNEALSQRRVDAARNYLLAKGIAANRIKVSYKGEGRPIAKNDLSGQDTPAGRQFNRRVEIYIYDANGQQLNNLVEIPNVPTELKQ